MLNNRGQSLITFVILIPIILMLLGLIFDVSLSLIKKRDITNSIKYSIEYGLKNIDKDEEVLKKEITNILNANINDIESLDININNSKIEISISSSSKGTFSNLFDNPITKISVKYIGYYKAEKIIIERG